MLAARRGVSRLDESAAQPLVARPRAGGLAPAGRLTLGRPDTVSLLFHRRPNRRTKGRFETRVVNVYTSPTITFRYKHSTVKQYLKDGV